MGVDLIAETAGTTKKTLYDRFGSKDELVARYLRRRADVQLTMTDRGPDSAGFADAVAQAMSRPAALAAELASVRAERALARIGPAAAQVRMAGLLIGAELAAGWLADCYAGALTAQGVTAGRADPAQAWRDGMRSAHRAL